MGTNTIPKELQEDIAAIAESAGCELLHVGFKGGALQVFLDHPEGVTIENCQAVARELSPVLDVHDFGNRRYVLEVSSPGLDRELYGPKDYQRFTGSLVRVTYVHPETSAKQTIVGTLDAFDAEAEGGRLTVSENSSGSPHHIPLTHLHLARLEIDL